MGIFGAAHGGEGGGEGAKKPPPSENLWHIQNSHEAYYSYTLPREDPKNI